MSKNLSGTTEVNYLGHTTYLVNTPPVYKKIKKNKVKDNTTYPKSINEHLEKKKQEIPLFDPHTGEINVEYESLTGKKNPLLELHVNNGKTPLLNSMPLPYEPKFNNRFIVNFEKDTLPSWVFKNITRPSIKLIEKKIFGFTYKIEYKWDDIEFEVYDPIGPSSAQTIHFQLLNLEKPFQNFNFELYLLDPTGVNIEKWDIIGCVIKSINYGKLEYKDNSISTIKVKITPKNIKLRY
jgi:hypothetical protein